VPRVMTGHDGIDIGVTLFGKPFAGPLAVGAFAADRVFHDAGLLPVARACQHLRLPMMISEETVTPLADIASVHDACWLQLRAAGKLDRARGLIDEAARCGVQAIVLTVLAPVHPRPGLRPGGFDIGAELLRRGWSTVGSPSAGVEALAAFPQWSWNDVRAIAEHASGADMPVLVKGVLHGDDASLADAAGCRGVIVSNIGLRQVGRWAIPLHRIADIRGRIPEAVLLLDGGVRHGADIVTARCLGATITIATRPVVAALVAGGETAVRDLLAGWLDEVATIGAWLGVARIADLDASFIVPDQG
jgi:4-hydroxymandelate oxidase